MRTSVSFVIEFAIQLAGTMKDQRVRAIDIRCSLLLRLKFFTFLSCLSILELYYIIKLNLNSN